MKFREVIHHNRDENSFTARLFEGYLLPLWVGVPSTFQHFIKTLALESEHNHHHLQQRLGQTAVKIFKEEKVVFSDAMLFLENMDIYGYCADPQNAIDLKIDANELDKTEFDCVVVMEDDFKREDVLVFEVKCFTDLHIEEVVRQNQLLQKYREAGLFNQFYHFAILSEENIERGSVFGKPELGELSNGLFIISWSAIINYIDHFTSNHTFPRFIKDIEFQRLYKSISRNGERKTPRRLIADRKPEDHK